MNLKIETPDKQNATFDAGLRLPMSDTDPDYPAMVLANYMFGGSITVAGAGPHPESGRPELRREFGIRAPRPRGMRRKFGAGAISNPKNTPKVEASFQDELAKTLAGGFTADESRGGEEGAAR